MAKKEKEKDKKPKDERDERIVCGDCFARIDDDAGVEGTFGTECPHCKYVIQEK